MYYSRLYVAVLLGLMFLMSLLDSLQNGNNSFLKSYAK